MLLTNSWIIQILLTLGVGIALGYKLPDHPLIATVGELFGCIVDAVTGALSAARGRAAARAAAAPEAAPPVPAAAPTAQAFHVNDLADQVAQRIKIHTPPANTTQPATPRAKRKKA